MNLLKKIAEKDSKVEEDETDLFFACMSKIVKKLPEKERVYIRLQIGTLVGNAELRFLSQPNFNDISRPTSADSGSSSNFTTYNTDEASTSSSTPLHTASCSDHTTPVPLGSPDDTNVFLNYYNL